jgi:pyruvate, water dikinase
MSYVAWFKELNENSLGVAGGKGTNLGIMFNLGLPVPEGFVITAQTYKKFIEDMGIDGRIAKQLEGLDIEETEKLQRVAKQIQDLIMGTEVPEDIKEDIIDNYEALGAEKGHAQGLVESNEVFVAVRSSATAEDLPEASFAGQQATFLNVKGKEDIVKAVRACWASLFTARAIYYREKNNFQHMKVFIAVVVQRMVDSEKSGVMFTINPATNQGDELVIEAVYGLGEMIVSGEVSPDFYSVDKKTRGIKKIEVKKQEIGMYRNEQGENEKKKIARELQERQILNEKEIKELARFGLKIEEHYKKPQDIEWAIEKGEIYIVQARAVTTFKPVTEETEVEEKEEVSVKTEDDEEVSEEPKEEVKGKSEGEGEILVKGETASSGVYSGKVRIINDISELGKIEKGEVMVTKMTTPDMVPAMQKAGAIVTDEGGMTCHAAIVSREMGTPCIVGTEVATKVLKEESTVTVNATQGIVYSGEIECKIPEKKMVSVISGGERLITGTEIKVIMDLPDMAERAAATGADGVGLVRIEIMIANGGVHPAEYIRQDKDENYVTLLKEGIGKIAKAFAHKPVWVRCSDLRTDEYRNLQGGDQEPKETDPMIGWHAIRRLLDEPRILKAEFKAIKELHEEGLDNVGVMLPFVIRVDEVRKAKEIMREMGLEPCRDIDFGVMVETPASCWIMEELCHEGISFVSFGTNDLTQLTLGIDRNNGRIAKLFDEMHPAVLGEIAKVIKTCKKYNVKTSICGQAGSRPVMAEFLVHQGVDSISANADAVTEIREVVARTEKKLLLDAAKEQISQDFDEEEGEEEEFELQ